MGQPGLHVRRALLLASAAAFFGGCASQGPSLKERADEAAQRRKSHKEQEEFTKSLPPTDSKPIFKP